MDDQPQAPPPGPDQGSGGPPSRSLDLLATPLCLALMAACAVATGAGVLDVRWNRLGVLYGPAVLEGQWWRLLTNVFFHGGAFHLLMNLSAVWTLGRFLERALGTGRFALLTLVGALGASAAVLAFNFDAPTLGISGVILAWAGFALPVADPAMRRQLRVWLVQVAVLSVLPGISWAGHLGGFLAGLPAGATLRFGRKHLDQALPALAVAAVAVIAAVLQIHR